MSHRSNLIDQLLEEARKKGIYNAELRGEGPLLFDDMTHVDPADRVAFTMLKSNGFAPPFIEERAQLIAQRKACVAAIDVLCTRFATFNVAQRHSAIGEMRRVLPDLWRRTLDYNLIAPPALQIEGIRVEYELTRIESSMNDPRPDTDGYVEHRPQ